MLSIFKIIFSFLLIFHLFCSSSLRFFTLFVSLSLDYLLSYFTEKMVVNFPCKICNKTVASNHHALQCDSFHLCVHIKCNRINLQIFKYLNKCSSAWYCSKCYKELIPFTNISNKELYQTNQGQKIKFTAITKMVSPSQDLIVQLNDAVNYPCLKISQLNTTSCMNLQR